MNGLVSMQKGVAVCDSLQIAKRFEKRHDRLIAEIERMYPALIAGNERKGGLHEIGETPCKKKTMNEPEQEPFFFRSSYIHPQNKQRYPRYLMTRDGFSLLVMGFTGEKALEWKLKYIRAFNQMEKLLQQKQRPTYQTARNSQIEARKQETEVIKSFVAYAAAQGSQGASWYYIGFSRLADKTAGITDRNTATEKQLSALSTAEAMISCCILEGMRRNEPYRAIYAACRARLESLQTVAAIATTRS